MHNWVKWPERESDHKPQNAEIMSGAIILSLYKSVQSI